MHIKVGVVICGVGTLVMFRVRELATDGDEKVGRESEMKAWLAVEFMERDPWLNLLEWAVAKIEVEGNLEYVNE